MAISSSSGGEYLDVKVFLYKYTPQFTLVPGGTSTQQVAVQSQAPAGFPPGQVGPLPAPSFTGPVPSETVEGPFQITQYKIDLNVPKYFSKFDISHYTKAYNFSQGLYGNVFDWTINLQDAIIPFGQLSPSATSTVRKTVTFRSPTGKINGAPGLAGPPCRSANFVGPINGDLVDLMAQYEAESNWPSTLSREVNTIIAAYIGRGKVTVPYASNSQGDSNSILNAPGSDIKFNNPQLDGLRLSDLIQKYNYMSVFVYKSTVSPQQAIRTVFPVGTVPNESGTPDPFDLSNEVHLMLAGYKNEFNGFVTGKSFSRVIGQVDQLTVTGHGSLRLFSDTTTLFDPSITAKGFYDASILNAITPSAQLAGEPVATNQYFSFFQNLFQGEDPIQILTSLLYLVYKISFNPPTSKVPEYRGFYDIFQLVLDQSNSTVSALDSSAVTLQSKAGNMFVIAPFLLSIVMALRNHHYNLQTDLRDSFSSKPKAPIVTAPPDNKFASIIAKQVTDSDFAEEFGGPCVQISGVDATFQSYFKMLKNGFSNYLSGLKTPNAVMAEVTLASFLEFYERPNGRIILRTIQYNQPSVSTEVGGIQKGTNPTGNMVTSNSVPVIQASYLEDGTQLQTQKRSSWSQDFVGGIGGGLIQPSYGNGKLMMQYGFREAVAEPNPVLAALARSKTAGTVSKTATPTTSSSVDINKLVHKYLRFLLEFDNAGRRTGTLTLEGDPSLEVGKLFFDYKNNKMGYIVDVQKQMTIGGTYTASINLKFVRDIDATGTNYRQLPTIEELATAGTSLVVGAQATSIIQFPSVPAPTAPGSNQAQIFSNLKSGLTTDPFPGAQ